jgi:hypothetical protein
MLDQERKQLAEVKEELESKDIEIKEVIASIQETANMEAKTYQEQLTLHVIRTAADEKTDLEEKVHNMEKEKAQY